MTMLLVLLHCVHARVRYWTIIPVLIGLFYQHHPHATADALRSRVAMGLLWAWSIRLTHSYFRCEALLRFQSEHNVHAGLCEQRGCLAGHLLAALTTAPAVTDDATRRRACLTLLAPPGAAGCRGGW